MKKYIVLSLIFAIAGLFLCISVRTLKLVRLGNVDVDHGWEYCDKLPENKNDRALVEAYLNDNFDYAALQKIRPDDYVWLIQSAWLGDLNAPEKEKIINDLRRLDPQNGCTDYLQAAIYAEKAGKLEFNGNEREYKLLDRNALEKSMYFYNQALKKPYVKIYSFERPSQIIKILELKDDPVGTFQRIGLYAKALLPHLQHLRMLAASAVYYAELLEKEGRKEESRKILASGRDFVLQWTEYNSEALIEPLVYTAIINVFHEAAQKSGDKALTELYGKVVADWEQWKNKKDMTSEIAHKHGGILSAMLLPALKVEVPIEIFTPERKLNYLVIDRLELMIFAVICAVWLILLASCAVIGKLCGKEVRLIKFSRQAWLKIIGIGIILPIAVFLLFSRIDAIGGRNLSIYFNTQGMMFSSILLIFMGLWLISVLRIEIRKAGKINFASHCLSAILPYAVLLFFAGAFLGTYFEIEQIYYHRKDTLFRTARVFSKIETQLTKERTDKLVKLLNEK